MVQLATRTASAVSIWAYLHNSMILVEDTMHSFYIVVFFVVVVLSLSLSLSLCLSLSLSLSLCLCLSLSL